MRVMDLIAMAALAVAPLGAAIAADDLASAQTRAIPVQLQATAHASGFVALDLIEHENNARKIFRVTFPSGMQIKYGTWLIVDGTAPLRRPFAGCTDAGCVADYDASPELMQRMKARRDLILQAVNASGKTLSASMRLDDDFWTTHHAAQVPMEERLTPWRDDRVMTR
jgi:hypothetical protein